MDYRSLQKGEISQSEFNANLRCNTARGIGSIIGGSAGVAVGIPVGHYIYEGVGAIIGAIIFGMAGSEAGEYLFETIEQKLEHILISNRKSMKKHRKLLRAYSSNTIESGSKVKIRSSISQNRPHIRRSETDFESMDAIDRALKSSEVRLAKKETRNSEKLTTSLQTQKTATKKAQLVKVETAEYLSACMALRVTEK